MNKTIQTLMRAIDVHKDTILAAERYIWSHPETGYKEWETHAYLKSQFERLGYLVTEAGNIPGFWVDVDTGRPGPCVAVFGEMDALTVPSHPQCDPKTGAAHACGHNCQCAALLGIAAALKADGALDALSGSIRLIAVPAEELIELSFRKELKEQGIIRYFGGKQEFMYRGVLDKVDISFIVHASVVDRFSCDKGSNGCIVKEATFTGKAAHAGTAPYNGVNALYAANCGMQAANALRETFKDDEHVRFHPIITSGGAAVNAIPDRVTVESYVRGATMDVLARENQKVNRAFSGSAAAMGCGLHLWDHHGYAPRQHDLNLKEYVRQAGELVLGSEYLQFDDSWDLGCSDMGDVTCIMPALHPAIGGASGTGHGADYRISDPVRACVDSAKVQCAMLARLLADGAAAAQDVLCRGRQDYPSIKEYLAFVDSLCLDRESVSYREDGTATLSF